MSLEFKKIEVNSIREMLPFYAMRHNMTCDSVFLESYVWKDYYNVRYAIWENKALLWLMENEGRCFSAMPLCREEDLPGAFAAIEEYFNEELGYPLVINLADEYINAYEKHGHWKDSSIILKGDAVWNLTVRPPEIPQEPDRPPPPAAGARRRSRWNRSSPQDGSGGRMCTISSFWAGTGRAPTPTPSSWSATMWPTRRWG
mgnify:CR=1 FL=1